MPRGVKQALYLLLFLAFWALVIGVIYWLFVKPAPSCFDNRQNQGEEGVDCGGPCAQFCIPAALAPIQVVGDARVFQPTSTLVSMVVKLQNPNTTFAAQAFNYTAVVNGDSGKSLTINGSSYIYAGDIKYLALLHSDDDIGRPVSATFTIGSPAWVPERLFVKPQLRIQAQTGTVAPDGTVHVDGIVASDDTRPVKDIVLTALFVNAQGELLGVSTTQLDTLAAGATTPFTIVHPGIATVIPGSTQVFVNAIRP